MARIREHEPMNYDIEVVDQPLRPIAAAAWATTWERFPGEWGGRLGLGAAHEAVRRWGASQGREITGERRWCTATGMTTPLSRRPGSSTAWRTPAGPGDRRDNGMATDERVEVTGGG